MKRIGQKEYMTKNSKVIKSIIDLKVGTRFKITWNNQDSLEHERTNDLQPLPWNFFIKLQDCNKHKTYSIQEFEVFTRFKRMYKTWDFKLTKTLIWKLMQDLKQPKDWR
jgi:hypothetical protein